MSLLGVTPASRDEVAIELEHARLQGTLAVPENPQGLVIFAHGSGSNRYSPRNRFVSDHLNERSLGTLMLDLLTADEASRDARNGLYRFDVALLVQRVTGAVDWAARNRQLQRLRIGLFGASTGAAAALIAASRRSQLVHAVVSRGGRPDLADDALPLVRAPTLFVVGATDTEVLELNQRARTRMRTNTELRLVPGAGHLFEEPGAIKAVAQHAVGWFLAHLS
jgi:putative phosphoribosyl transferase